MISKLFTNFLLPLKTSKMTSVTSIDLGGQNIALMTPIKIDFPTNVILFNFLIGRFLRSLYLVTQPQKLDLRPQMTSDFKSLFQ